MPNWAYFDMEVTGEIETLKQFREAFKSTDKDGKDVALDSEKILPYPEEMKKADKEHKEWQDNFDKMEWKDDEERMQWIEKNPQPKDGYNAMNGYDWCRDNWGSKWGICEPDLVDDAKEEGDSLHYYGTSPWCIPEGLFAEMSRRFPDVTIVIDTSEESNAFVGEMEWQAGELVRDDTHEPSLLEIQERNCYTDEEMVEYYGEDWKEE